jgi:hypothetical protein
MCQIHNKLISKITNIFLIGYYLYHNRNMKYQDIFSLKTRRLEKTMIITKKKKKTTNIANKKEIKGPELIFRRCHFHNEVHS